MSAAPTVGCRTILNLFALGLVVLVVNGCLTAPKIDWRARVGFYHYDQAVTEFGPPDKQATLSTGETVAEWTTRRTTAGRSGFGTGIQDSGAGMGFGQSAGSRSADRVLRLTFDKEKRLVAWLQN